MIAILDYGSGNIQAIRNIFKRLNIQCQFASSAEHLEGVSKIILPGVGAFDETMLQLNQSGLREILDHKVLEKKTPILGVCVGMQIMADSSDEGKLPGLGWFPGHVKRFDETKLTHKPKIPHMGWNDIQPVNKHQIFNNIDTAKGFYFLHSYYFECQNIEDILSTTSYGIDFASSINKDNIFGFQFHPEKSHSNGVNLFQNFADLAQC